MGLDVPDLDDRAYEALLEDLKKRIPIHSDEWTDHNAHDPGITILELLAWIAETDIYRLNRLSDEHVEKYLQLMGASPAPPRPASTRLKIEPPATMDGTTLPVGERLAVDDGSTAPKIFETTAPITLTDARIDRIITEHASGRIDNTNATRTAGLYFHPFGEQADAGSTMYLGFDGDPFGAASILDIEVEFHEDDLPAPAAHGDEDSTFEPSVAVDWEYCTDAETWYRDDSWSEVPISSDGTDQLYHGGTITLERPSGWSSEPAAMLDESRALCWLRCTVVEPGYEIPPQVNSIDLNVVTVDHRQRVDEPTPLRRADGTSTTSARPGQTFVFDDAPILDADIRVGGTDWTPVSHFDASGPDEEHYVLDHERGAIQFGNNVAGTVPEAGQAVVAMGYTAGGGPAGNVQRSADWRFERTELDDANGLGVEPLARPSGGTDAESIESALTRLQRDRKTPYRAVAPADYRAVATSTPGLRFGRAATVVDREEPVDDCQPHTTVRVVVVPFSTLDRPTPSEGFLEAVDCHLQKHRLVTDRIDVEPPTYVGVSVATEVSLQDGYSERGRTAAVQAALDEFLHPLHGFDGDGWPFGRPVYPSEVYEAIESVDGIECAHTLSLSARGAFEMNQDGTIVIADGTDGNRVGLVYPEAHDVTVAPDRKDCGGT